MYTTVSLQESTTLVTFTIHLNARQVLVLITPHWKVL